MRRTNLIACFPTVDAAKAAADDIFGNVARADTRTLHVWSPRSDWHEFLPARDGLSAPKGVTRAGIVLAVAGAVAPGGGAAVWAEVPGEAGLAARARVLAVKTPALKSPIRDLVCVGSFFAAVFAALALDASTSVGVEPPPHLGQGMLLGLAVLGLGGWLYAFYVQERYRLGTRAARAGVGCGFGGGGGCDGGGGGG